MQANVFQFFCIVKEVFYPFDNLNKKLFLFMTVATIYVFVTHIPTYNHPWLADLAAPVGSQEVVDHTHKW